MRLSGRPCPLPSDPCSRSPNQLPPWPCPSSLALYLTPCLSFPRSILSIVDSDDLCRRRTHDIDAYPTFLELTEGIASIAHSVFLAEHSQTNAVQTRCRSRLGSVNFFVNRGCTSRGVGDLSVVGAIATAH